MVGFGNSSGAGRLLYNIRIVLKVGAPAPENACLPRSPWNRANRRNVKSGPDPRLSPQPASLPNAETTIFQPVAEARSFAATGPSKPVPSLAVLSHSARVSGHRWPRSTTVYDALKADSSR